MDKIDVDYNNKVKMMIQLYRSEKYSEFNDLVKNVAAMILHYKDQRERDAAIESYKQRMQEIAYSNTGGYIWEQQYGKLCDFLDDFKKLENEYDNRKEQISTMMSDKPNKQDNNVVSSMK